MPPTHAQAPRPPWGTEVDLGDLTLVGGAGLLAGAINAAAGGGTLISFPALVAVGLPPVTANITSSVGLVPGYLGGSLAYREELSVQKNRVRRLLAVSVVGGVLGAVLLLVTSAGAFRAVVPYLVLLSCLLLALQPRLARVVAARVGREGNGSARVRSRTAALPLLGGVLVAAVYGSYFGAGLGVLLLAVLGIFVDDDIQRLNALKGLLSLVVNLVGVLVFLVSARVAWTEAAVLAVGSLVGGTLGVRLARLLPAAVLRGGVVVLGLVVGVVLLVRG